MKTDFSVNVQIELGIKPEVVELVEMLVGKTVSIGGRPTASVEHVGDAPSVVTTEDAQREQPKPKKAKKVKSDAEPTAEAESGASTTEEPQAENKPEDKPEEGKKEFTEEDVRAAMHKTRQRIEGEDYKEHTDSEMYQKYHKPLTAMFKNIAATLGAEKPSTLAADKREDFILKCNELIIQDDGSIGLTLPF